MPEAEKRQAPPPDERNLVSARLLTDLVTNTLDPGYRAAARRRGPDAGRPRHDHALTAAGALLVGFLLVVAYVHTNRGAPQAQQVHNRLVQRVRAAQNTADSLAAQLDRIDAALTAEQAKALPAGGALAQALERARTASGQSAVTGPGLEVTLSDPAAPSGSAGPGRPGSVPLANTHVLTDRDIRSVVNQLWSDGAEAIAVNGVRLTPTSAIRFAGQAVLVDFAPIASPYRIDAIGDKDVLATGFAQSAVASRYQTLKGADGIGFSFSDQSTVDLPAGTAVTPRYAKLGSGR